jgi:PAS domain S-box-containing protein
MSLDSLSQTEKKRPSAPDGMSDEKRASLIQSLLGAIGVVLFVLSLIGVHRLAQNDTSLSSSVTFSIAVGLVFIPLLLLSIVVGIWTRGAEERRLQSLFKARYDKLQSHLNYREDLLRLVADHQPGSIAIFDRHNRYWFVNRVAASSIGKEAEEIIGQPPLKVLGNDRAKKLEVRLAEARASDVPVTFMDQVTDEKGAMRFIQVHYESITPYEDMTGCVLVSEEDLTTLIVERERRERMLQQVIETLVAVVDRRDPYAAGHSSRVGQLSRVLAEEMGLSQQEVEAAGISGSLMNFGKVLVSRRILTKTTALTPEELQRVRDGILTSADILAIIGFEGPVVPTLRQILERFDGTGAPEGLKGEQILLTARIVAASNAFVALVSPRAHRPGLSFPEALKRLTEDADKAFDHRVIVALTHYIENRPNKLDWLASNKQG